MHVEKGNFNNLYTITRKQTAAWQKQISHYMLNKHKNCILMGRAWASG